MNRLPNMIVLDFCEYLKSKLRNGVAVLDLLSDESNSKKLRQYAEEYLRNGSYSFKGIIHKFIDSEYFDRSLHRYPMELSLNRIGVKHLRRMVKDGHCYCCCERGFFDFLDSLGDDGKLPQYNVDEWSLIDNVRHALRDDTDEVMLHCMTSLGIDLSNEIDFLEWIINSEIEPLKISKIPVAVFESLIEEYLSYCGKGERARKQLLKSFKQTDGYFLGLLLERLMPDMPPKRTQSLQHVIGRYYDEKIPYKCVYLPLAAETNKYKRLINDYWRDLHHISENYLDIYYSETDYGKSGSEIQNSINSLPQSIKTTFPCIVLWGGNIKEAKSIDTSELENYEIVRVVSAIVNAIKDNNSFDLIVKEANNVAEEIREKDRPVSNNTVNIQGDNHGVAVAENIGSISNTSNIHYASSEFSNEVAEAIGRIRQITELTAQQQTFLADILSEAKEAFNDNSEIDKEKSKSRFKDAMCFLGNVSVKVLSALSSLANLSKFFGIVSP
ncbi:MAG: hypothetical protein VB051_09110 [Candidatus Pelethousia sp.]|nr:hypothetical protein [Candidatus Pelethousia sp.]